MDLQNTFYTLGIIYLTINTLLLICIGVCIILAVKAINNVREKIQDKINTAKEAVSHPEDFISLIIISLIKTGIKSVSTAFTRKSRTNE